MKVQPLSKHLGNHTLAVQAWLRGAPLSKMAPEVKAGSTNWKFMRNVKPLSRHLENHTLVGQAWLGEATFPKWLLRLRLGAPIGNSCESAGPEQTPWKSHLGC